MRRFLVLLCVALMAFSGIASAQNGPPDEDPTCDRSEQQQSGEACPGDNGDEGCQGINVAEGHVPPEAEDAFDLVTDILSEGEEGDCKENGNGNGG